MYAQRRERVREAMGPGAVALFLGARLVPRSADTHFPFRQDSDFHYLTGFDHPHAAAILRTDGGPPFTLFVEPTDPQAEIWTGSRPGIEGARRDHGADEAHPAHSLPDALPGIVEGARQLHHVLGRDPGIDAKLLETLEGLRLRSRQGVIPPSEIKDPRAIVHEMRLRKDAEEIETMRRAAAITCEAHAAAARLAHEGRFEYELEAALTHVFRQRGAAGPAYDPIVGSGANATVLHYIANDRKLRRGELVLIDAGCELEGYASDVTRTYPVGGRYEGEGRAVYEVVLAAQAAGLEGAAPGSTLKQIHDRTLHRLVEGMLQIGILKGSADELIETESYKSCYMHSTSHWLGLDVHDVGTYTIDGKPRPLEPGMVFTVEPGIYVSPRNETVDPRFRGIGVRIEDDVLITADGSENLTASIPKRPEDVEAWVNAD